jgi:RimJ/RimL family protein N-acetyltransferase
LIYETERFIVRWYREGDGADAYEMYGDPEVWRYLGNGTHAADPDADYTERALLATTKRLRERTDGLGLWAIEERATGGVVGTVGLAPTKDEEVELAYHLARAHWGRGIATEASAGAVAYGFEQLKLERIIGFVHPPNVVSIHVLEKLGFARTGEQDYDGAMLYRYERDRVQHGPNLQGGDSCL